MVHADPGDVQRGGELDVTGTPRSSHLGGRTGVHSRPLGPAPGPVDRSRAEVPRLSAIGSVACVAVAFHPSAVRGVDSNGPGEIDYRLARQSVMSEYRKGRLARHEVCDAHPELVRAAREVGEPRAASARSARTSAWCSCPTCSARACRRTAAASRAATSCERWPSGRARSPATSSRCARLLVEPPRPHLPAHRPDRPALPPLTTTTGVVAGGHGRWPQAGDVRADRPLVASLGPWSFTLIWRARTPIHASSTCPRPQPEDDALRQGQEAQHRLAQRRIFYLAACWR